jgi:hypothetical protein
MTKKFLPMSHIFNPVDQHIHLHEYPHFTERDLGTIRLYIMYRDSKIIILRTRYQNLETIRIRTNDERRMCRDSEIAHVLLSI